MASLRRLFLKQCQPPRTGPTNIDNNISGLPFRLSDVGIDERTITKIVAKINQINLERECTRRFSESERGSSSYP
eukprot:6200315-Pleurochrysis_carterae.AAC.3